MLQLRMMLRFEEDQSESLGREVLGAGDSAETKMNYRIISATSGLLRQNRGQSTEVKVLAPLNNNKLEWSD
jgi:hypothetical protein